MFRALTLLTIRRSTS